LIFNEPRLSLHLQLELSLKMVMMKSSARINQWTITQLVK